jgi:hypothetical protein
MATRPAPPTVWPASFTPIDPGGRRLLLPPKPTGTFLEPARPWSPRSRTSAPAAGLAGSDLSGNTHSPPGKLDPLPLRDYGNEPIHGGPRRNP